MATTYTLTPTPKQTFLDANGDPLASGYVYTYEAGLITPATTYADSSGTPNANPVQLDSAGRCTIYLTPGLSYGYIVKDSTGALVYSQDNIGAVPASSTPTTNYGTCQGRLTGTAGTPVTQSNVTAATSIFFTPYLGNLIGLYDGSAWSLVAFTETTISLSGLTASKLYDIFAYNNNGVLAFDAPVQWTNGTTRATALTLQDGIYVKSGSTTRRYIGTISTTGSTGQTEDSVANRFIWNYYNRAPRPMYVIYSGSWAYTTATWRQANNSTSNQVNFVVGVAEVPLEASVQATASNNNATGVQVYVAAGLDTTTAPTSGNVLAGDWSDNNNYAGPSASLRTGISAVGSHYVAGLEYSTAASSTTWNGGAVADSGVNAVILG